MWTHLEGTTLEKGEGHSSPEIGVDKEMILRIKRIYLRQLRFFSGKEETIICYKNLQEMIQKDSQH